MDYEGTRETETEVALGNLAPEIAAAAAAGARTGATPLVPGPDNTVILPDGASLQDLRVVGRDLVVTLDDGRVFVIPDGAVFVPQIVAQGVAVPPLNLAALLVGNEPEPAAGAPRSSGGNFAVPVDPLQAAYKIGDLLPYTELAFPEPQDREIIPERVNRTPDVEIEDGSPPSKNAVDEVNEAGLPGNRTGNVNPESPGSSAGNSSHITDGRILIESPDGIGSVTINGITITGQAGQVIDTPRGNLVLGALADGQISYVYTLKDNTSGNDTSDVFTVVVTDPDGDSSTATLTINIIDDVPTARNDIDDVPAQNYAAQTGNVTTGAGTTSGAAGADTAGADGATVTGVHAGTGNTAFTAAGTQINGQYGTLTLNADGSYTYTRALNTPGGVSDVFTYQVTDGDGDTSTATLTVRIADAPTTITFVPEIGEGTEVLESHLPPRNGESQGSQFDGDGDVTSSTITFVSPDGVGSVSIGGTVITPGSLPQTVVSNSTGTLVITGYTYNAATGQGTISYTYTLLDNTLNTDGSTVSFPIVVTDLDNDSASDTLDIRIIDDAPTARNDSGTQTEEDAPVTVNVITNDTKGADGVSLTTGVALVADSLTGAGTLVYNNDGTFTYTPAPGEEGIVTFQYRITDGDGDPSVATVTITLLKDSEPSVEVIGENTVFEAGLPARGDEPAGSDAASDSEKTSGTLSISTGNDTLAKLEINGTDVTAGGTVTGAHGTLVVTLTAGVYSYVYTLTDNTLGDATTDDFMVVVTDSDGDSADTSFSIAIIDDEPAAIADTDSIAAGEYGPATGNVITDAEADGGKDTPGADGVTVTAISGSGGEGTVGGTTTGTYGTLTLNADGSYSYTRNPGTPGGVTDTFTYTITDADGDPSSTTLKITIADSPVSLDLPVKGEAGTSVNEAGLPTRGLEPAGSDSASNSETTSGTITYTAPDGPATVKIDNVAVTSVGQTFAGDHGTLTITGISAGTITYSYTLTDNTLGDATTDSFAVVITDQDGDPASGTLTIDIVDDVPTAKADIDSVTEDGPTVANGNVLLGGPGADANATDGVADTQGADGASVTAVSFGSTAGNVNGSTAGAYGTLTLNSDGSYSYQLNNSLAAVQGLDSDDTLTEVFTYTITDADGDPSTTTLTITINGSDDPITINGLNLNAPEEIVDEDDLADGSSPNAGALTQTGSFTVTGLDGISEIKVGGVDAVVGQTFTTAYGTFTITGVSGPVDGSQTAITISYSYVLTDNTAHPNANGQNFIDEVFTVAVKDTDGSVDTDTVEIRIIDDVPTAVNDTDTVPGGTLGPATGNVITDAETDGGKDTPGADGVTVTAISGSGGAGTVGGSTAGTYGTLTLNADGSYSYTRNAGTPGNVSDVFTYTITDADGDTSSATLTILIEDNAPVTTPNAIVLLDDDTLGGNPGGPDDRSPDTDHLTGTLSGSGGDGALTWNFETTGEPAGFDYVINGTSLEVWQGATKVITVTLNPATGAYTVTQNAPIVHVNGLNENNQLLPITYTVKDADGDPATGTLTIDVDDDSPLAANDSNSVKEDGPLTASGSVLTGAGADSIGADGPATGGAVTAIKFGVVTGTVGSPLAGAHGSLTLNANGSYTYTLTNTDPAVQALDDGETLTEVFTYTITDKDGDPATATLTITINGNNDAPVAVADTNWTIEDAAAPITGNVLQTIAHTGAPSGSFSDRADSDVDGETLTVGNPGVYAGIYGTLTLNADGTYSYVLNNANPAVQGLDTGETLLETFNYTAFDGTASTPSTLSITIFGTNDAPVAVADTNWTIEDAAAPITGNVLQTIAHTGAPSGSFSDRADSDVDGETLTVQPMVVVGTYGTLTLLADGSYTYVLDNTNPAVQALDTNETLTDDFAYLVSDGTADVGSTLTITIFGANDAPVVGTATTAVSDEGLLGGIQDNTGNPTDTTNLSVRTGTISITDVDGEGQVVTLGLPTGSLSADGVAIVWSGMGSGTLTGTAGLGGPTVVTIAITNTGSYTVTLLAPIDQIAGNGENVSTIVVPVTSSDGTASGNGSLTVNFEDDSPTAVVATTSGTVDEDGLGNGIEGGADDVLGTATTATGSVTGLFNSGADTPLSYTLSTNTAGLPALTSGGVTVTYAVTTTATGTLLTASAGAGNTVFTLALNSSTGAWTFTLVRPLDHATGNGENDLVLQLGSLVTATDADGDQVAATGNLTVTVDDDTPVANNDGVTQASENAAVTVNVFANDQGGADGALASSVALVGGSLSGAGSLVNNGNGTFTYTPAAGETGTVTFQYTITDRDGDTSTATATITLLADSVPQPQNAVAAVDDDGLTGGNPASTTGDIDANAGEPGATPSEAIYTGALSVNFGNDTGTVSFANLHNTTGTVGTETVTYTWSAGTNTLTATGPRGVLFTVSLSPSGAYTVTLVDNVLHAAGGNETSALVNLNYLATDSDGDSSTAGMLAITFNDDAPTLGPVQNQQASNDPSQAPAVGTLHFAAGADGAGSTMTITANTAGITVGGHNLVTNQSGNVLTAYADNDNSGTFNAGDTAVFTITVNPSAGTSGQYVFDLITPLDPVVTDVPIGSGSSFGVGPSSSVVVTDDASGQQLVMVTGWSPNGGFTAAEQDAWQGGASPAVTQTSNVNGSTQGWGLGNNNFDQGEFLRFDFGTPDDYDGPGGYTPPANTLANVTYATFSFFQFNAGETIKFVAHYTNGTTEAITINGPATTYTITAPAGTQIAWIDTYQSTGDMKLNLTNVGVSSSSVDETINATVQLSDADGDTTSTASFSIHVATGLSPLAPAAPVVLDLDGDGTEFLAISAGTTFDYNGDGTAEATAWAGADDGILAIDANGSGTVDSSSEFVFGAGDVSDLEGVAAKYDSNQDGVLDAKDAAFAQFGVWQDADSDGVSDAGEFRSLGELGITAIGLTSDGQVYGAAGGDVTVVGEGSFTRADGSSGILADAVFATADGTMDALLSVGGPAAGGDAQHTQDLPMMAEALADAVDAHAVDSIVDYFAAGSAGAMDAEPSPAEFALQGLLAVTVAGLRDEAGAAHFYDVRALDHDQAAALA